MLSAFEIRVVYLKESMREMKETLKVVEIHTDELDPMKEQSKEYVAKALSFNMDSVEVLLNIVLGKPIGKNDAFEARMTTMKEENKATVITLNKKKIKELEEELVVCRAVMGKRVLSATLNREIDVLM
ncbi:hypothetical protein PVK06_007840 [Gossypium arboreum]|uniref:Uncharacterized protein n=1 Tax=Gossypium arboreum TaxID=29729 RepID=A0ABR0QID3_GOSAR|nr:hypothetical protein PVK06_007840 [Gossypium arboreum]